MMGQGLALTAVGMTFVFLFLALLILAMRLLAGAVRALEARYPETAGTADPEGGSEQETALAIAVASTFMRTTKEAGS